MADRAFTAASGLTLNTGADRICLCFNHHRLLETHPSNTLFDLNSHFSKEILEKQSEIHSVKLYYLLLF